MVRRSATLVSLGDAPNIRVDASIVLVGRSSDCDIVVNSKKFSRRHCCIAIVDETYLVVRDLGSTNGIQVNGTRKLQACVYEHDEVKIANNLYRVQWDGASMASVGTTAKRQSVSLESQRSSRAEPMSDSLLEECDEPIALSDSGVHSVTDQGD